MANTKPRARRLVLRFHRLPAMAPTPDNWNDLPDAEKARLLREDPALNALEGWLEHGDPSGLILPTALTPRKAYLREQAQLISAMQKWRIDWQAVDLRRKVREMLPSVSERNMADLLNVPKTTVHRIIRHLREQDRRKRALMKPSRRSGPPRHQ